ncbi:MAG: GPR endopeptidase [Clostridia bacterium]|nr:GPR endopeptidase [Clostridia bacterium]
MSYSARTDLALEAREIYLENSSRAYEPEGVSVNTHNYTHDITVTEVIVSNEKGSKALGKGIGTYITIDLPSHSDASQEEYEEACRSCARELEKLLEGKSLETVLVIGLGNRNITADALGPKTADSVLITRHLINYMPEEIDNRLIPVCAISPGVLGITGVETGEIVKGICEKVNPSLVIAIDALCSRRMERLNNSIQLTDTGIVPGAGIGNRRMAIDKKTLGVPVIAIGVPTVVEAATIAGDTIDKIIDSLKAAASESSPLYKLLTTLSEEDRYPMIREVLSPSCGDFIVTPKEVDSSVASISKIIANGINIALHKGINLDDIDKYR